MSARGWSWLAIAGGLVAFWVLVAIGAATLSSLGRQVTDVIAAVMP